MSAFPSLAALTKSSVLDIRTATGSFYIKHDRSCLSEALQSAYLTDAVRDRPDAPAAVGGGVGRATRLRRAVRAGEDPCADQQADAVARRRTAGLVPAVLRPVRRARGRRSGDHDVAGRDRRLPGRSARSDPAGQAGRVNRPPVERPLCSRRGIRVERRGTGRPRSALRRPHRGGGGQTRRDAGALGQ